MRKTWSFYVVVLPTEESLKCTKNYNARAQALLMLIELLFGDGLVAVVVVVCLSSLGQRPVSPSGRGLPYQKEGGARGKF